MTRWKSMLLLIFISLLTCGCGGGGSKPPTVAPETETPEGPNGPNNPGGPSGPDNPDGPTPTDNIGLTTRPANSDCLAMTQSGTGTVSTERAFPALNLGGIITGLYQAPNDTSRWYATLKSGSIVMFNNDDAVSSVTPITGEPSVDDRSEGGLLSMAFHPDFGSAGNRLVYLSYTATINETGMESRITRYVLGADNSLSSPLQILSLVQPADNHNGGNIVFGPDGYLYIGFGDGGGGGDEFGNGQNPQTFHSKILRIDVNNGSPYVVPTTNPYFGSSTNLNEIYAQGFRNPWRFSFDRVTGELFVADVGQHAWEEVNTVDPAQNFGWPITEGNHCYNADTCTTTGLTPPLFEYNHDIGCSITGGFVYRGSAIPELQGRYIYGDWCMTGAHSFLPSNPAGTRSAIPATGDTPDNVTTFGEGLDGELLIGTAGGGVFRFIRTGVTTEPVVPEHLTEHPCIANAAMHQLSSGVMPYSINNPLWSDGTTKQRFFAIPDTSTITVDSRGDFIFPVGSVLIKNFLHDNRLIETRFLMHHEGGWGGYSYEWNEQGTDATLSTGAHTRVVDENYTHIFPSSTQCFQCHTQAANVMLGPETAQLNRNQLYESTGITGHQLDTLEYVGLFTADLSSNQRSRVLPALDDTTASTESRARAYMHSNCSGCHQPDGFPSHMDLRYDTALAETGICNIAPTAGELGISGARLLLPGDVDRSILYQRMARRDSVQMPPLATGVLDTTALNIVAEWIESLSGCND